MLGLGLRGGAGGGESQCGEPRLTGLLCTVCDFLQLPCARTELEDG